MNPLINTSIRDPNPTDVCFVLYKLITNLQMLVLILYISCFALG